MLIRYCDTRFQKEIRSCDAGWGSASSEGIKSCYDSPAKENCRNLIDPQNLHCPYCGEWIENPFQDCLGIPRDDYRIVKE